MSPTWKSKVGVNTSVRWPAGIGAKGNEGVANNVANTQGSIGYVEYAYALQNKLTYVRMINKAGKAVAPTSETFQAAAANADWKSQPGYGVLLANQPGDTSWPITGADLDPDVQAAEGRCRRRARRSSSSPGPTSNGGKMAEELHYVPMPANVVKDIQNMWARRSRIANGKPLLTRLELNASTNWKRRPASFPPLLNFTGRSGLRCGVDGRLSWLLRVRPRWERVTGACGETNRG